MEVRQVQPTVGDWERIIGRQVRDVRIASEIDQSRLAGLADVSIGALSNLERGNGSSLKTFVAVVRALGRTEWLEGLAAPATVSPIQTPGAKPIGRRTRVRRRAEQAQATRLR
jgi:transcriptional regulator with XRE-family HTH domain